MQGGEWSLHGGSLEREVRLWCGVLTREVIEDEFPKDLTPKRERS